MAFTALGCSEMKATNSESHKRLLTRQEFLDCFSKPMTTLDPTKYYASDVWTYVSKVPSCDLQTFEIAQGYVPFIYKSGDDRYDHIYVSTKTPNVFLMVLYDRQGSTIYGHHLLDLNVEYGINSK